MKIWTKRLFALVGFTVVSSLALSPITSAAVTPPTISIVKISPETWNISNTKLLIKGHLDAPGKWRVDLINLCTGETAISQTGEKSEAGDFEVNLNSNATEEIVGGPFQVVLTPSIGSKLGTAKKQYVKIIEAQPGTTQKEILCENAARFVSQNTVTGQILAINNSAKLNELETTTAVLFPYSSDDVSIAAFATNYAVVTDQLVLTTNVKKLSKSALREIQRRQITHVKIIGSKEMISKEVATSLKAVGVKTRRFDGSDVFALAPIVWSTYTGSQLTNAVITDFLSNSSELLQALAFANAQKSPLLPVTNTKTKVSKDLLLSLGITSGKAVVNPVSFSDISLAKFSNFTRLYFADAKELSIELAQELADQPHTLFVRDKKSAVSILDLIATTNPVSIWPADKSLSDFDAAYISTRPYVQKIYATDFSATLSDSRIAAYAREIYKRDAPKPLAEYAMPEIKELVAPANFAFSGSGWGHGIGMSQWGAYAMANAGKSAAEILTYYFTGTEIGPAIDDADVWVSLQNRIRSLTLRLREVNGDIGTWRLTADDGTSIDLTANETASFTFDADAITVTVKTSKDQTLGPTEKVVATWSGTRFDKDLGDTASAIQ
ncbi:MAG: Amidase enhancer precursor, partial [Actinomycetota bacterium]